MSADNSPQPPVLGLTELILSRRSARDGFAALSVDLAAVELIVRCGLAAPSSKSARPWAFHVVTSRALIEHAADAMRSAEDADSYVPFDPITGAIRPDWASTVRESADLLAAAPVAVFVENRGPFSRGRTILLDAIRDRRIGSLVAYTFEVLGVGAAVENMWLAAESAGLVATFMGDVVVAEKAINRQLGIQGDLVGALAFGHPLESHAGSPNVKRHTEGEAEQTVTWHSGP